MTRSNQWRLSLKLCTLVGLIVCLFLFFFANRHGQAFPPTGMQFPTVSISQQPNPRLRILSADIERGGNGNEIVVVLVNETAKPIRAYALLKSDVGEHAQNTDTILANITSPASLLLPNQTKVERIVANFSGRTELSVDFVEFSDGTTWGADVHKSSENLAGQRAGAHGVTNYFKDLLKSGDQSAVLNAVASDSDLVTIPANHSRQWESGFKIGVAAMRKRLRHASQGGLEQIKSEVERPYDASEGGAPH
jgi:hypothetical protein